ncbi:MAG TPA: hypothetical protein PK760_13545, partial [Flavobacteriales bacterium]|nr:hypothetical protein [Flavobacteriales bacterium]
MRSCSMIVGALLCSAAKLCAQPVDTVLFTEIGRYQHPHVAFPNGFSESTFSSRADRLGRPYLYMACKDSGLMTLDISLPAAPIVVDRLLPTELGDLFVMNMEQVDD